MSPASERPFFCIADPSLKDFVGHHFAYDSAVANAAAAEGYRPVILAHKEASDAVMRKVDARRCFRRDIWHNGALASRLPGRAGTLAGMVLANRDFHADLTAGLVNLAPPPGSILLAHMIARNQLPALARFAMEQPARGPLRIILLLRYQSEFYDNFLCASAFRMLERAVASGRRVRLATDSARLSREFSRLTTLPVEVMPIPLLEPVHMPARPRGALRFVSLGNARGEKGYLDILDAIRILWAGGELNGIEFVLQSNDPAPDVRAAIDRFSEACPANVTLVRHALPPEEYDALLLSADVVLVPYWRSIYRSRTSGVFLESVAAGKIVIATRDTWMSDELDRYGAGVLIEDRDPAAIAAAIRTVRDDHAMLAARAASGAAACRARHNPAALVRQAAEGPPRTVRHVAMFYPWNDFLERRSGASVRCDLLMRKLAPLVEEVRVLQGGGDTSAKTALPDNVRLELAVPRPWHHLARRLFRLPFRLMSGQRFGQELGLWYFLERRFDPEFRARASALIAWADVVLLEYPYWAGVLAPICRSLGKPLIVTCHDVLSDQAAPGSWTRTLMARLEREGLASADHAVCVSDDDRAWFAEAGVVCETIPNPVDAARLAERVEGDARAMLRDQYGIVMPPGAVCLFVGSRFAPNVEAAASIRRMAADVPGPVALVIAGACAAPGSGPNWVALGKVADGALSLLYQLAALVLIPLRQGTGSSVKTVEALAAGKVVLGTAVAFRGLTVRPGEDCVCEDDLMRWPGEIGALLADPDRLATIGAAARRAGAAYDYRTVFEAYLPLLGVGSVPKWAAPKGIAA